MALDRLRGFHLVLAAAAALVACSREPAGTFATPEEAVQTIADVAGTGDLERIAEIFGPSGAELLQSGDEVADREDGLRVKAMILEKVAFEDQDATTKVALLGNDAWPFAIPLVLEEDRWRFDTEAGREELLNRRIGRNELQVLASLHAYVDAQREYFSRPRDGKQAAYARRFWSNEGAYDGLYWPTVEGEPESPLGPLLAEAAEDFQGSTERQPFHGYYFRILEAQGASAPGGTRSYLDEKGQLTLGFAAVAWPSKYDNSGVMTFLVSHQGLVFQKDLGEETATLVEAITAYDPDESWTPTPD